VIKIAILLISAIFIYSGNLDSFSITNALKIYGGKRAVTPIPPRYIISDIDKSWDGKYRFDNKSIDLLLKADEKLYIYTNSKCYIDTSNDGILFKREYLRYQNGRYEYENNQPRDIGVRLYCPKDSIATIKISYNPAILENYKADDISLDLNKKRVIRASQAKSRLYYYLPQKLI